MTGFNDYKSEQERLQIAAAEGISNHGQKQIQIEAGISDGGKGISDRGKDYKSVHRRLP